MKWLFFKCGACYGTGYLHCNDGRYNKCPYCENGWIPRFWKCKPTISEYDYPIKKSKGRL